MQNTAELLASMWSKQSGARRDKPSKTMREKYSRVQKVTTAMFGRQTTAQASKPGSFFSKELRETQ